MGQYVFKLAENAIIDFYSERIPKFYERMRRLYELKQFLGAQSVCLGADTKVLRAHEAFV